MHKVLQALGPHDAAGSVLGDKAVHPFRFEVPYCDAFAVIFNIEGEILAHHSEPDNTELRRFNRSSRSAHMSLHEISIWNF